MVEKNKSLQQKVEESGLQESLKKILEVRLQRQQIYSDEWKDSEDVDIFYLIKEKTKRLESFVIKEKAKQMGLIKKYDESYEKKEDTLKDLIIWSLFMLENHSRSKK